MKRAKRVYKRKSTIATQTDDVITKYSRNSTMNCHVQLRRLRESLVQPLITNRNTDVRTSRANELINVKRSLRNGNTKEVSSLVHPAMNRSLGLSRLPSTYSHFAKSITNNEKANSTLADISNNGDRCSPSLREENQGADILNECIVLAKPGPKSYKQKFLQRCIDLQRPVALNVNQCEEKAEDNSRLLQTILECPTETSPKHDDVEVNVNEISLNCDIHTEDIQMDTEALRQLLHNVDDNQNACTFSEVPRNIDNREFPKTRTVQIGCEGFTATIAASRSQQQDTPHQVSSQHNGSGEDTSAEQKKYIKIHAHTVHIHNHFYKS